MYFLSILNIKIVQVNEASELLSNYNGRLQDELKEHNFRMNYNLKGSFQLILRFYCKRNFMWLHAKMAIPDLQRYH